MRLLHTADWHLGDRLGRIDRTPDLRIAVERIAAICKDREVETLLVAGDLFSELARPDGLRETIEHWQQVFGPFLTTGGTIISLTGNHDNENFCQTLSHVMNLAAPLDSGIGAVIQPGRLYLATEPTLIRLPARAGGEIQFVLMPYPTPSRYFRDGAIPKYESKEEKQRLLEAAFYRELRLLEKHERFSRKIPSILSAHINVRGSAINAGLFRISEADDVVFDAEKLRGEYAYVALGHVHKPQTIAGAEHVRYSGSIEKMDLGEGGDNKCVILLEMNPKGLAGPPEVIPIPSTAIYELNLFDLPWDLERLREESKAPSDDLVKLDIRYTVGKDNLEEILKELGQLFPRWYDRAWVETGALGDSVVGGEPAANREFDEIVREYIRSQLTNHSEQDTHDIMERLDALLQGESA